MVILTPIITNELLLIPAISSIVGDNRDWLQFYGSYLGAIIGASATIYVFIKTIMHHRKQDIYQHQIDMLDKFREIASDYIETLNPNHIKTIINDMDDDYHNAYYQCELLINNYIHKEIQMSLIISEYHDSKLIWLFDAELEKCRLSYRKLLDDIKSVLFEANNADKSLKEHFHFLNTHDLSKHGISSEIFSYFTEQSSSDMIRKDNIHNLLLSWVTEQFNQYNYHHTIASNIEIYISDKSKAIEKEYNNQSRH